MQTDLKLKWHTRASIHIFRIQSRQQGVYEGFPSSPEIDRCCHNVAMLFHLELSLNQDKQINSNPLQNTA